MLDQSPIIYAEWDEEAKVWVAESDDIPGLVAEAETIERLVDKLVILAPLLELPGGKYELRFAFKV